VLAVEAVPVAPGHADAFDLQRFRTMATVLCCETIEACEHIQFSDGLHGLQLMVTAGSLLNGPVCLNYLLSGLQDLEAKLLTLRRFSHLCRAGRFARGLYPRERKAERWIMMLRAWDGLQAGASQREIAAVLFGARVVRDDWDAGFLRSRIQRLIREARKLVGGGYRMLLR